MFSSEIFLRKFILKIYLRKFIFENLSLRGKWKIKSKNESMKMKKIASRKIGHERFTTLRTCICFRMCLPPDPIQCHFILKTRTWNSTAFLMNFHDDLHPPDPNQRQICKKFWTESFSHLPWGRTGHARKWIRFDDIDWGQGERMKKNTVPHCEVLVHSVPYFSITFITLFKSFSKSFWKFKNLKMKMYFHFLFKFCWFRKCSKMIFKNVCSTCFC